LGKTSTQESALSEGSHLETEAEEGIRKHCNIKKVTQKISSCRGGAPNERGIAAGIQRYKRP